MKNKNIFILMLICICLVLASCGKTASAPEALKEADASQTDTASDSTSTAQATAQTSEAQPEDGYVAIVGGETLMPDDIGYYVYNNAVIEMMNIDENASISTFDFSGTDESGTPLKEKIVKNAITDAVNDTAFRQKAEDCGYDVEAARTEAKELIDGAIQRKGEDGFKQTANALGISDSECYEKIYTDISVFDGVAGEFVSDPAKYIDDVSILSDYAGERGASVKQILVISGTADATAAEIADSVQKEAASGADFGELMREYNEDTSDDDSLVRDDDGIVYTFPEGEMVKEFEEAAFALKIGEVSDVVRSDYGFHIIKRIAGAYELQAYWAANTDIEIADNAAELVDFDSVIEMVTAVS